MKFIRDIVAGGGNQAIRQDAAEDIMRLAHDPLLLHDHLQSLEHDSPVLKIALADGQFETRLQKLTDRSLDRLAVKNISPKANRYAQKEKLVEASFHPEVFAASNEDRNMAIDQTAPLTAAPDEGHAMPANLISAILIVFGFVLATAAIFDLLAMG